MTRCLEYFTGTTNSTLSIFYFSFSSIYFLQCCCLLSACSPNLHQLNLAPRPWCCNYQSLPIPHPAQYSFFLLWGSPLFTIKNVKLHAPNPFISSPQIWSIPSVYVFLWIRASHFILRRAGGLLAKEVSESNWTEEILCWKPQNYHRIIEWLRLEIWLKII